MQPTSSMPPRARTEMPSQPTEAAGRPCGALSPGLARSSPGARCAHPPRRLAPQHFRGPVPRPLPAPHGNGTWVPSGRADLPWPGATAPEQLGSARSTKPTLAPEAGEMTTEAGSARDAHTAPAGRNEPARQSRAVSRQHHAHARDRAGRGGASSAGPPLPNARDHRRDRAGGSGRCCPGKRASSAAVWSGSWIRVPPLPTRVEAANRGALR